MKPQLNLSLLLPLLTALMQQGAAQIEDAFDAFGRGVKKEIAAVKQPIDETIAAVGETQSLRYQSAEQNKGAGIGRGIQEVAVGKQTVESVDKTTAAVGETQCSNVKKLIGVDYEQVSGVMEPDLNKLSLNFISRELKVVYNLTKAAQLLPEARGYDVRSPLIIYIHGFTDDPSSTNFGSISQAFLKIGEYNILGLDASSLIRWLYLRSTTYVRFIGERLGEVLAAMVHKGLNPRAIHLIGHSLGSHIAGFTGKQFTALTGGKVGRISGLDPAGPCFTAVDPELRLKATDADFVDVIHTDSGVYGINERVGDVDFFPNGGSLQPGCLLQTCSHSRVNELYAESITNPDAFLARACADYDAFKAGNCTGILRTMGYYCEANTRGSYYLRTGEEAPYGLGQDGARWENNEGIVRNIGNAGAKLLG